MIRIWDPLVRIFHWGLVAAFAVAFLSGEDGMTLHRAAGYAVGGLVAFRLVWGLVGPRYARFAQFVRGPGAVRAYLADMLAGRERRYVGHNPAGGAMILAMLFSLAVVVGSGLALDSGAPTLRADAGSAVSILVSPAQADEDGDRGAGVGGVAAKALHEAFTNLLILFIALHVGGVVLASRRHRENLARAMLTGEKRAPADGDVA